LFQRISQIEGVERAAKTFESLGASVKYNVFPGAHRCAHWRTELAPALQWLIGQPACWVACRGTLTYLSQLQKAIVLD
jgi:hypothetical protein